MTVDWADIRTERLLLRPLRPEDRADVVEIQSNPDANRYNPDPPTRAQASKQLESWLHHWDQHGFGYLAVVEQASGRIIGVGGVQHKVLTDEKALNLYYRFLPDAWGKGYATEMASAVVEWAERELPWPVIITVALINKPSLRVAEKLGFANYEEIEYEGLPSRNYRR
ncbi:GNAT family N-acetyltransferase [Amycolatopsis suaedae]|uniref:N-acetyltransferase n=1 Tax=Amycolatopsis suaedae TaxID=2510978 RepID=A0A4Q7IWN9_9PSEU|nr:GNAT family N-acetyltransferase [Amycolatopsis suaedae]RZQ59351.1 N-acetyltransferase [Amycolatopsis suaedae]